MRLKLDENLGARGAERFRADGHDVTTVVEQALCSTPDIALIEVCRAESRCLVTLDLDFANPLRFRPARYTGIAVLRLPPRASRASLDVAVETLVAAFRGREIAGKLWVIEAGRLREYQDPDESV